MERSLGSLSCLATLVKEKNWRIATTQCKIHQQALALKTLLGITLVNALKNSALVTRIFKILL
jgi:hypothetical protein